MILSCDTVKNKKGSDILFSSECSKCSHRGKYTINQLVEVTDYWQLSCENCNHPSIKLTSDEREKFIQGIHLTEKYAPDIQSAYKLLDKNLPSKIEFGSIEEED